MQFKLENELYENAMMNRIYYYDKENTFFLFLDDKFKNRA